MGIGAVTSVYASLRADGARGAVRVLHPDVAVLPDAGDRFLEGARLANKVGNSGAVRILEDGEDGSEPFVVMALLEGQSMAARAAARGASSARPT